MTTQPLILLAAGGTGDMISRDVAQDLEKVLGVPIIVENRTGASASIAADFVARSAPDGCNVVMAVPNSHTIGPHLLKLPYDPLKDFTPITLAAQVPHVLVVGLGVPAHSMKELVDLARANPGKLNFSSSGIGNPQQLAGELMNHMAGTDVLHVPYRGAAPAVTDVATGAVTMSFTSLAAALPLLQDGRIRAVAITSRTRMPQLPDVMPLAEAAPELKDYELLNWFGLFATGGTPEPILAQLNDIANRTLQEAKTVELLMKQGIIPRPLSPAEFKGFIASESEKFAKVIDQAKIKPEG